MSESVSERERERAQLSNCHRFHALSLFFFFAPSVLRLRMSVCLLGRFSVCLTSGDDRYKATNTTIHKVQRIDLV